MRRRKTIAVCAVVLLLLAAAVIIDRRLKSSDALGYVPANAEWTLRSSDVPGFLEHFYGSTQYREARAAVALPRENWPLRVRHVTGIRPTPQRWSLWMGPGIAAACANDHAGICVRPGLLLHTLSRLVSASTPGEIHSRFGHRFAWRDGFLIVSKSPNYLRACLDSSALQIDDDRTKTLAIQSESIAIEIDAHESLPARIRYKHPFTAPPEPLTLTATWPEEPVIQIAGANPAELLDLLRDNLPDSPMTQYLDQTLAAMRDELPDRLATEGQEFSLGLVDIDLSQDLPIPELALLQAGRAAGGIPDRPTEAIPFEWFRIQGWVRPWLGEKLAVCVAADGRIRYMANQERLMPTIVGRLHDPTPLQAAAFIAIDWSRAAPLTQQLLQRAAELELLPRSNPDDIQQNIAPYLDLLANLGTAQLQGTIENDELILEGVLTKARQ